MMTRSLGVWCVAMWLGCAAALAADAPTTLPGVWVEAELVKGPHHMILGKETCSGGHSAHVNQGGQWFVIPLTMPAAIERPRLYVRSMREYRTPMKARLLIGPKDAKSPTAAGVKTLVEFDVPTDRTGRREFEFRPHNLPRMEAGEFQLFLATDPVPGVRADFDLFGFVDRDAHPLWQPPDVVKDGRLVGTGGDGPAVRVEHVGLRSPLQLVYGDEVLDKAGKPLTFDVTLMNMSNQPAELPASVAFSNEAGPVGQGGAIAISLKPEESRTLAIEARPPGYGWFSVNVVVGKGESAKPITLTLGVLRRPAPGVKPDSLFGLNTAYSENDLAVAQMIGVKWRRGTPASLRPEMVAPAPGKWWTEKDYASITSAIRKWKDAGILTLGLVDYNTPWNVADGADGKPVPLWRNRPKDLTVQAEIEYRIFKAFREDITYWEIWNEPWVKGWTWQTGTAQDYRDMSRLIWEKTKADLPEIMLIGGGSTSYQRDVLFAPGNKDIGYVDGCSTHPYNSPDRTMPSSAAVESKLLKKHSRSGGVGGIWATEIGAPGYSFDKEPVEKRDFIVARTVAPLYLLNRIGAGDMPIRVFYFCCNWGEPVGGHNIWNNTDPLPAVVAYSAMTHFLEDGQLLGDLYETSTAMWAPHFVKPDGSSVVAFWAEDGYAGRMTLPAGVFEAFDHLGAPTGDVLASAKLRVDFQRWGTVYLVSKRPVEEVRAAMRAATFERMDSLRINPRSFTQPLEKLPPLRLKVQNLLPQTVDAEIAIQPPAEIELAETKQTVRRLESGEIRVIEFAMKKATPNAVNRYRIDFTSTVNGQLQRGQQVVQAAYATFGTPAIDGKLDDWANVTPVTLLSRGGKDFLEAALNPDKAAALLAQKQPGDTVAYRVWTRWDQDNFYFAAEVPNEALSTKPLAAGEPDAFPWECDGLQLAFDCLATNPDDWFANHPLREKCLGSEVDYEFAVAQGRAKSGGLPVAELHRLKAPGTNYQTIYDTNVALNPPLGVMNTPPAAPLQGQVVAVYDEVARTLRYEVAIPWANIKELGEALKALQPGGHHLGKFAFGVNDMPGRGKTFWTQEAGDLQSGAYGFSPTWSGGSTRLGGRILTDWGFVR